MHLGAKELVSRQNVVCNLLHQLLVFKVVVKCLKISSENMLCLGVGHEGLKLDFMT